MLQRQRNIKMYELAVRDLKFFPFICIHLPQQLFFLLTACNIISQQKHAALLQRIINFTVELPLFVRQKMMQAFEGND